MHFLDDESYYAGEPEVSIQEMQESAINGEEAEVSIQETDAELQDSYYGEEEPELDENDQYHKEM